ncbi:MAG: phosphohydrolase, partial [Weissella cibaria]
MKTTLIVTHTDLDGVMAGLTAAQTSQSDATILYAEAGAPGIDAVLQQVLDDIEAGKLRKPAHEML